jgi:hypothetical protein
MTGKGSERNIYWCTLQNTEGTKIMATGKAIYKRDVNYLTCSEETWKK